MDRKGTAYYRCSDKVTCSLKPSYKLSTANRSNLTLHVVHKRVQTTHGWRSMYGRSAFALEGTLVTSNMITWQPPVLGRPWRPQEHCRAGVANYRVIQKSGGPTQEIPSVRLPGSSQNAEASIDCNDENIADYLPRAGLQGNTLVRQILSSTLRRRKLFQIMVVQLLETL